MSDIALTLIANPVSGRGGAHARDELLALLPPGTDVRLTSESRGAEELARSAVDRGAGVVVAAGGDGTVSAVASALVGTSVPLGIIPRGTANSFAATMGIPDDAAGALEVIRRGRTRTVDTATCNGRTMILMATVGLNADTILDADQEIKGQFGALAYVLSGLDKLRKLERFHVELEVDGRGLAIEAAAVTVANAAPPWSVLARGPDSVPFDDGMLDVTVLSPDSAWDALAASAHIVRTTLLGREAEREDVASFRATRIVIRTRPARPIAVDGEGSGETPARIACVPASLDVLVPPEGS